MFKKILIISILLTSFHGFSQSEDIKDELRENYLAFLTEEGFRPQLDEDKDISFKSEGTTYYIIVKGKNDFTLSRYLSKDNACSVKMLKTLNKTNRMFRNVTTYALKDCKTVVFSSRSWLNNPDDWKGVFYNSLSVIKNAQEKSYEYFDEF
ncbi:MAG: hypothetical protein ACON4Y_02185 [Flavobacteriales bacterium]